MTTTRVVRCPRCGKDAPSDRYDLCATCADAMDVEYGTPARARWQWVKALATAGRVYSPREWANRRRPVVKVVSARERLARRSSSRASRARRDRGVAGGAA